MKLSPASSARHRQEQHWRTRGRRHISSAASRLQKPTKTWRFQRFTLL